MEMPRTVAADKHSSFVRTVLVPTPLRNVGGREGESEGRVGEDVI